MRKVMIRYRVKADRAEENRRYIEAVFAELERTQPAGLRYTSFVLEDGVTFVHLAMLDSADGSNPLTTLASFQEFTARIRDRCEEPPVTTTLSTVGAYRLFTDGARPAS